jgi:hypothetical protein
MPVRFADLAVVRAQRTCGTGAAGQYGVVAATFSVRPSLNGEAWR